MLIQFTRDFQSLHTGERFYEAGAKANFDQEHAQALINEGAAVFVTIEARRGQVEPAKGEPEPKVEPKAPLRQQRSRHRG